MSIAEQVDQRLRARGISRGFDDLVEATLAAIEGVTASSALNIDPAEQLTENSRGALSRAGLDLRPADDGDVDPLADAVADHAALLTTALDVSEVAQRLGVDPTRVRHRLEVGALYGVKVGGRWRLPVFQFTRDGLVAGIDRVLPSLPVGLHPVTVYRWLTLPCPDLEIYDDAVSPLAWLATGGDPERAAAVAADL